jgi:RimJ/RimL family protein N-acetyltransferase
MSKKTDQMQEKYIFTSDRLGFRNWTTDDLPELTAMNADVEVMKYFPKLLSWDESSNQLQRMQKRYYDDGYTYFATELKATGEFIGFIGLAYQEYETDFTPATDIGWRLIPSAWGKGYATEGALKCLEFGFKTIGLKKIISTCILQNIPSENVMKKIGMTRKGEFIHPLLSDYPSIEKCVWYEINHE